MADPNSAYQFVTVSVPGGKMVGGTQSTPYQSKIDISRITGEVVNKNDDDEVMSVTFLMDGNPSQDAGTTVTREDAERVRQYKRKFFGEDEPEQPAKQTEQPVV